MVVAVDARLRLLSVNVGRVASIGRRTPDSDRDVRSAIGKRPVATSTVEVTELGIVGDAQADRRVHGGPQMAVYAYPADHFAWWAASLGPEVEVGPGTFGENLTVAGLVEDEVRVGDRFAWGDVVLRVTKPRSPCFKLDMKLGRPVGDLLLAGRRTGWYLAVDVPGTAPTGGDLVRLEVGQGPTISEVVTAKHHLG